MFRTRGSWVDYGFENTLYMGDAIPYYMPNIGPDSFTAFLGGKLAFMDEGTSWAEPFLEDLSGYDPVLREDNEWWRFMCELIDRVCEVVEEIFWWESQTFTMEGTLVATIGNSETSEKLP